MSERDILRDIRETLGLEPDLVLWRNSVGAGTLGPASSLGTLGEQSRFATYGLPKGSSDLIGILRDPATSVGRFFALEVKSERGRASPEQILWLELVRKFGGFAAIVRSVDDAKGALNRARNGSNK